MKFWISVLILYGTGVSSGVLLSRHFPRTMVPGVVSAIDECTSEIEQGCPLLLGYASMLEEENARLNQILKAANVKKKVP